MIDKLRENRELISYLFFGVATTAVNWIFYVLCVKFLLFSITLGNMTAWVFSVVFAYVTNKLYVFNKRNLSLKLLIKEIVLFFGSRILSGVLDVFLPSLLIFLGLTQTFFGIKGFLAKTVTAVVVIVLNYILSKIVVFRKKNSQETQ